MKHCWGREEDPGNNPLSQLQGCWLWGSITSRFVSFTPVRACVHPLCLEQRLNPGGNLMMVEPALVPVSLTSLSTSPTASGGGDELCSSWP